MSCRRHVLRFSYKTFFSLEFYISCIRHIFLILESSFLYETYFPVRLHIPPDSTASGRISLLNNQLASTAGTPRSLRHCTAAFESKPSIPPGIKRRTNMMERPKNTGLIWMSGREISNKVYITDTPMTGPQKVLVPPTTTQMRR